jgi:hypothetical protein
MTIDVKCPVCKSPDRRRAVEAMWNAGMTQAAISRVVVGEFPTPVITKHLKDHAQGDANGRAIVIQPEVPTRERVLALQQLQLDEVERRIELAKERALQLNAALDQMRADGVEGADTTPYHDWSEFVDILGKDMQAAIGSILKAQGLTDKRDMKRDDLKLGLFEAMQRGGLAPKALSGGEVVVVEVDDDPAD